MAWHEERLSSTESNANLTQVEHTKVVMEMSPRGRQKPGNR